MSEIRQAADLLRRFNAWRCGSETIEAPEPAEVTRAIALVCSAIHSDRIPEIERAAARLAVERAEFRREAETLRDRVAELEAKAAQAVADDVVLLPAEATDEMQDNMRQALIDQGWGSDSAGEVDFADIWHAGVYEYQERTADRLAAQQNREKGQ